MTGGNLKAPGKRKRIFTLALLAVLALAVAGLLVSKIPAGDGEVKLLKKAVTADSLASYQAFLEEYPDGEYAAAVRQRLEELKPPANLFAGFELYRTDQIKAYEAFLKNNPASSSRPYVEYRVGYLQKLAASPLPKVVKITVTREGILAEHPSYTPKLMRIKVAPILQSAGLKVAEGEAARCDATLDVHLKGEGMGGSYVAGGASEFIYTGARVAVAFTFSSPAVSRQRRVVGIRKLPQRTVMRRGSPEITAPFDQALRNSGYKQALAEMLINIYGPEAAPHFLVTGVGMDMDALEKILYAQGAVVKNPLWFLLDGPDPYVQRAAIEVLGKLGGEDSVEKLVAVLDRERPSKADLQLMKFADLRSKFRAKFQGQQEVRLAVVKAIAAIAGDLAVDLWQKRLTDPDPRVRMELAKVLEPIPGPQAAAAIKSLARDEDAWVRFEAAMALGKRKDPAAARALLPILSEQHSIRSRDAAEMLGDLQVRQAVPALFGLLDHKNWHTRRAAAEALEKIMGPELPLSSGELVTGKWKTWWEENKSHYEAKGQG